MRKIFFYLLFIAFGVSAANAQTTTKRLNWGAKTGLNISKFNVDDSGVEPEFKTGFVAGVYFKIKAADKFSIQPEFLYSSKGGSIENNVGSTINYRVNYFSVPVLANIAVAKKFSVVVGPEIDILISARRSIEGMASTVTGDFKDASFGLTGGFEVWPVNKVGLSARYHHGLSQVTDDEGGALRTSEWRNQNIQLTLALRL